MKNHKLLLAAGAVLGTLALSACGASASGTTSGVAGASKTLTSTRLHATPGSLILPPKPTGKKYTVFISNNYMGNEWRPQMENAAKWVAQLPGYKNRVDLKIENAQLTPTAQISSLQSIIRQRPDAIMIDAASATALNPTVAQACKAGILVFTFDQVVTAPCAYKLPEQYSDQGKDMIEWLAKAIHGKGNILMDTGLPGIPISEEFVAQWKSTIAKEYPGIHIVGTFSSQYAPGPELQAVSALLAQHRNIQGILSGGYCSSDLKALKQAGMKPVPMTCLDVNGNEIDCAKAKLPCFFFGAPSFVSGIALNHIVNLLDKRATYPKSQPFWTTNFVTKQGNFTFKHKQKVQPLTVGVNYYPTESPSLITPVNYDGFKLTPAAALGK
jgi:ribose transport system substrate-binding protein